PDRRREQEGYRALDREPRVREKLVAAERDVPAQPSSKARDDAILVEEVVDRGSVFPLGAVLVDDVQGVNDDPLRNEREDGERDDRCRRPRRVTAIVEPRGVLFATQAKR